MDRLAVHMEGGGSCLGSGFSITSYLLAFGRLGVWVARCIYNRKFHSWERRRSRKPEFVARFLS